MNEEIRRIPRVEIKPASSGTHTITWLSIVILILDMAFLIWAIIRLVLIAFPRFQIALVGITFQLLALTREGELDRIFEAVQRFFFLPVIDRFNVVGDVITNLFFTILIFAVGFGIYKTLNLLGKRLVKNRYG